MKILKFGGKSLANDGIEKVLSIIAGLAKTEPILVDRLTYMSTCVELYRMAKKAI